MERDKPMTPPLEGKRALVTGGGSGLGRQMALALARAGAHTVVVGRTEATLAATAGAIEAEGGSASYRRCDVSQWSEIDELSRNEPAIDVLVNNAGLAILENWDEVTHESWREVMSLNVDGVFRLCQVLSRHMRGQGWGRIVNVASIYGSRTGNPANYPGVAWDAASYVTSKHAVIGLTRHLASRLGTEGVTVNALSPGMFPETEQNAHLLDEGLVARLADGSAVKRVGKSGDLDTALIFLCGPGSGFVTGQDIVVDGGWSVW